MTTHFWEVGEGRTFVGRLETESDLVAEIERFCTVQEISAGWVSVIGAVSRAAFAYYHQGEHRYLEMASDTHHEITGFIGNVSIRDGRPFLHAHATFGDKHGDLRGGHLVRGTTVYVAEVQIHELANVELVREMDEATGLALW